MNEDQTRGPRDTNLTQPDSRLVRPYMVVGRDWSRHGPFRDIIQANAYAQQTWPDQEQDETRSGNGWDIEACP